MATLRSLYIVLLMAGMAPGASVESSSLGYSMGAYGAAMSVYTHFIPRGRDIAFPKNTAMEIGFGGGQVHRRNPANPNAQAHDR
jgi:hypothetical protein